MARLTDREREILLLIGEGYTSREMADRLFLSIRTVEWHRARLNMKLGTSRRADLVRHARELSARAA